jgi:hypothetical protein
LGARRWVIAGLVAAATILLCLPFFDLVAWIGDEGITLRAAMEMARGKALYRDTFEFHPPGGFLIVWAWVSAFGQTLAAVRWLTTALAVGIAVLTFLACRMASGRDWLSAFLALVWVVASQGGSVQLNHHMMTTLISMGVMWASLDRRPGLAGVLSGAAGMVTQTRGALAALAALMSMVGERTLWRFFAAILIVPLVAAAYILTQGAVEAAWRDVIVWPATQYGGIQSAPFGRYADVRTGWAVLAFLAALVTISVHWRAVRDDQTARTCAIFAVAGLIGAHPRPDVSHLAFNAPLALPMVAFGVARLAKAAPRRWRFLGAFLAGLGAAVSLADYATEAASVRGAKRTTTPAGEVVLAERWAPEMMRAVTRIPTGERVFFYPYMPMVSFMAQREQVGAYDIFLPRYTSAAEYAETCRAVAAKAQWVVYDRKWTDPVELKILFPGMRDTAPPEFRAFEQALSEGFAPTWRNRRFVILKRKPNAALGCS